jgi:hypothetical protein
MLRFSIYGKPDLRQTVELIFYRLRVGCPWRNLPAAFGRWNAVYKRFDARSLQEMLMSIIQAFVLEPDLERLCIDGSIVKPYQHSSGTDHKNETAIGKSVPGNISKIHMVVDTDGLPSNFRSRVAKYRIAKGHLNLWPCCPLLTT